MKLPSIPLFTDTFTAETVHLSNEQVGIYIRLLCFAWTKNAKPFKEKDAMRICQCRTKDCELRVMEVLTEFFIINKKILMDELLKLYENYQISKSPLT